MNCAILWVKWDTLVDRYWFCSITKYHWRDLLTGEKGASVSCSCSELLYMKGGIQFTSAGMCSYWHCSSTRRGCLGRGIVLFKSSYLRKKVSQVHSLCLMSWGWGGSDMVQGLVRRSKDASFWVIKHPRPSSLVILLLSLIILHEKKMMYKRYPPKK